MKEMVGGCCVCSDERGWPENPLVYCDGQGCTVAVHQACYGIVTVPTGPWFCRKCESQERAARVRCELCPSRDGALKKTDNSGWAHVVCALYIPEVRFGNVTTMEPIILQLIPPERYNKTCYICTENGKGNRANQGACMQCNKSGCKQQFHVTCAQQLGLLCEEAGNYLDNVKYCGYCQHHYSKLKKGGNVKPIPPYKPISHAEHSSDAPSSPEKEIESLSKASSSSSLSRQTTDPPSKQRKSSSTSKSTNSLSSSGTNQFSNTQSTSNSSASSHTSSTSSSSGFGSNSNKSSSSSSNSSNSKDKDKHSKNTSKTSKSHDKDSMSSSSTTQNSSSSSSTSKSKYSKSNSSSNTNNNKDDQTLSSTNISSTTSHKTNSSNNSSNNDITKSTDKPTTGSNASILQPARLNVVSPSMGGGSMNNITSSSTTSSTATNKQQEQTGLSLTTSNNTSGNNSNNPNNNSSNPNKETGGFGQKFTTSNFTQSVVMKSDSVFGNGGNEQNKGQATNQNNTSSNVNTSSGGGGSKKRKSDGRLSSGTNIEEINKDLIKDLSVTLVKCDYDKLEAADPEKNIKKFCISQPKSDSSGAIVTTTAGTPTEPTLQNLSPNIVSSKQNVQSTNSSTSNNLSSKKEQQQLSGSGQQNNSSSTPSLVVSVPLSTANVPGVNLNLTSNTSNNNNNLSVPLSQQQQQQQSGNNSYQQSLNPGAIERQSPLQQTHQRTVSPAIHSISPIDHGMVHSGANLIDTQNTGIITKYSYDKHPNSRLTALQEEDAPTSRRSRNNAPTTTTTTKAKGRASKKRGANAINAATSERIDSPSVINTSSSSNNSNNNNNLPASLSHNVGQNIQNATIQANSLNHNNNNNNNNNSSSSNNSDFVNIPTSISPVVQNVGALSHATSKKMRRMSTIESSSSPSTSTTSRTPEVMYSSNSSSGFSGLKFGYESQTPAANTITTQPNVVTTQPVIKDSPPSSPGSEIGAQQQQQQQLNKKPAKKQKTASSSSNNTTASASSPVEVKENKLFHNGVHAAAHMLGNQLNPNSSMAPKLTESLNMEIEAHIANATPVDQTSLVGPTYPGKIQANRASVLSAQSNTQSLSSMLAGGATAGGNTPQSLEQLLERQWEQGSQFLMEQAQHFDIASLLSCLHQLKSENVRLEEHVTSLVARRDHLLAVNARLAIPLNPNSTSTQGHFNNMHPALNGPTSTEPAVVSITSSSGSSNSSSQSNTGSGRQRSSNTVAQQPPIQQQQPPQQYSGQLPLENGIDFRHNMREHAGQPPIVRHASGGQSYGSNSGRSGSMGRGTNSSSYGSQNVYNAHQASIRRDDVKPS